MKPSRKLVDWNNVLLDTSVILNYLKTGRGTDEQSEKVRFTQRLINYLAAKHEDNKASKACNFLISSISISEIKHLAKDEELVNRIVKALSTPNVEFLSFTRGIALHLNGMLGSLIHDTIAVNELAQSQGLFLDNLAMAREWISRDAMIIASAHFRNVDVILTDDSKTFLTICEKIQVPCLLVRQENFNYNDKYIFDFI